MTAYHEACTLLVCCEDGYRTELSLRPDTREEPGWSVAELHMLIDRPYCNDAKGEAVRAYVTLSREACRALGKALLKHARKRQ